MKFSYCIFHFDRWHTIAPQFASIERFLKTKSRFEPTFFFIDDSTDQEKTVEVIKSIDKSFPIRYIGLGRRDHMEKVSLGEWAPMNMVFAADFETDEIILKIDCEIIYPEELIAEMIGYVSSNPLSMARTNTKTALEHDISKWLPLAKDYWKTMEYLINTQGTGKGNDSYEGCGMISCIALTKSLMKAVGYVPTHSAENGLPNGDVVFQDGMVNMGYTIKDMSNMTIHLAHGGTCYSHIPADAVPKASSRDIQKVIRLNI